jgi:uncharacterized membrane protein YhaH (DUF805 family)
MIGFILSIDFINFESNLTMMLTAFVAGIFYLAITLANITMSDRGF